MIPQETKQRRLRAKRHNPKIKPIPSQKSQVNSEQLCLENMLSRISDSFVALDRNWIYTYVNERAAQTFGRAPEQLIGKHIWTEFPEGIGQPFYHAYNRAMETQQPIFLEEYYLPYDRWFENRIYPSEDGLSIFFSDITERKKVEKTYQETQERLSLAIRSANIGLWDWNLHTNKVRFSAEWKHQLGYQIDEISDDFMEWESRVHPDDVERAKAVVQAYLEKPYSSFQNEFRMRHKDGSFRWILAQASLLLDEHSQPVRMTGSHIDITEHRRAEEQFRYQAILLQNISEATIATDLNFKIKLWNAAAEAMYGWKESEVMGHPLTDFIQNEYLHDTREETIRAVLETGCWNGEVNQNRRDGTKLPILATVSIVKDLKGNPAGFITINRDITALKRSEELLIQEKQVLEMIARGSRLPQILEVITRNIEQQANGLLCTILLLDEDGVHVRHGAAPSMKLSFIKAIDGQPIGPKAGSCGTAAYRKQPVYVSDIATDPLWEIYREVALQHNLRACWSTPILSSEGKVMGTFAMYYSEPRAPSALDLQLIDLATHTAGIAIERTRSEEALRQSEERFHKAFHNSPDAITITRAADGYLLEINDAFQRLSGYTAQEVLGHSSLTLKLWANPADRYRYVNALKATGRITDFETTFRTKSGEIRNSILSGELYKINGDHFILGIIRDITERKRAQESLQRNEQVLRLFVVHSPAAIAMFDREMRYIVASRRYLADYELGDQDLVGRSHYDVLPEIPARWKEIHRRCLSGAVEKSEKDPFLRANGTIDWVRWEVRPWYEKEGEIGGLILFSEVITKQIRAHEEIHQLNAELEQRVQERTHELQLANQELEAFSYSVSHDLRAPLRAINGFAAIIARRHRNDLNAEGQHYFDNIVQASERMGQLIDGLLNYSRLGREGVRRAPVSLAVLLQELKRNMQSRFDELHGEVEIADRLPTVVGDQTLLSQVFINLLENAITYHQPDQPPKVIVKWQESQEDYIIQIADNGIGIPVEYQEKIFNMFQRLHSEDQYPGTGIGLANVKKSLLLLGGSISVESEVGQGTTFSVHLPKE